jgi:phosphoribosylglycinamide formyltransferase 1
MSKLPIVVMISGGGTTLRNLIEVQQRGGLDVEFRGVVSNRSQVAGVDIARNAGIPVAIFPRKKYDTDEVYSQVVFDQVRQWGAELIVMGGFLQHILIPDDFALRTINIHPSLIPAFSGHGFYGQHVHQAAIEYGVKLSGCTVHFVDNQFDHGAVIAQRSCPVTADDTWQTLQQRVFKLECELLPEVIQQFAHKRVRVEGRQVWVEL